MRRIDSDLLADFPLPPVRNDAGKEDRGRLLVIAGSRELAGAPILAGVAALRVGAGKLQIGTAASLATAVGIVVPEARVIAWPEDEAGGMVESGFDPLLRWAGKAQAVVLGCGLAPGRMLACLLSALLRLDTPVPLVLDAGIFDVLDGEAAALRAWTGGSVLLPHAGEMARLLGTDRAGVQADPGAAAACAAERFGAVALVKGAPSHVAAPDGRAFHYPGGGVGLATSGSGDVLAGLVGGLCARGADPLSATLWGVWLHGEAGRRLAGSVGRLGFLAREIADEVPALLPDDQFRR